MHAENAGSPSYPPGICVARLRITQAGFALFTPKVLRTSQRAFASLALAVLGKCPWGDTRCRSRTRDIAATRVSVRPLTL